MFCIGFDQAQAGQPQLFKGTLVLILVVVTSKPGRFSFYLFVDHCNITSERKDLLVLFGTWSLAKQDARVFQGLNEGFPLIGLRPVRIMQINRPI